MFASTRLTLFFVKPPDAPSPAAIFSFFSNCKDSHNDSSDAHRETSPLTLHQLSGGNFCPTIEDISILLPV